MAFLRTKNYTTSPAPTNPNVPGELTIDGATDPTWNDCEVIGGKVGSVYITNVRNLRISGMEVSNPSGIGVYLEQTGTQDVEITNCTIHDCGKEGIYANQGVSTTAPRHVNLKLTNNRLYNVGLGVSGDTVQRNGISCYASDCTIAGNEIDNVPKGDGIKVYSTTFLSANKTRNTGANGISARMEVPPGANPLRITGNDIALVGKNPVSATAPGIGVYTGATTKPVPAGIEIDRNKVIVAPNTPIYVQAPATATIHDNTFTETEEPPPPPPPPQQPPNTGILGEPRPTPGTICIMQADGPPGSALLLDGEAPLRGKQIALVGGAKLVAYGAAGRRAIRLTGALGCYVEVVNGDLALGTGDAAVEVIVRPDAVTAGARLWDMRDDANAKGFAAGFTASELRLLVEGVDGGGGGHPALGTVQYVAVARFGGSLRGYAGLTSDATAPLLATVPTTLDASTGRIRVGAGIRGLILGIRVSRRTARGLVTPTVPVLKAFPTL